MNPQAERGTRHESPNARQPDPGAEQRPHDAELANAVEPDHGTTVWRAGHERVVSTANEDPQPYGPENDTARPATDATER